ncbi:YitT family protein [Flavobacterium sp. H122]|uniref:YitT family protein n=1 Tax=Flavobacterium sp. H122 TaxID=2529860 RepID=UPI0010A9B3FF|nr:YitT family protein [Flavobacterium sp. H122]
MTTKIKIEIFNYCLIISGSFLLAFGVVAFLSPNHIATGGTAGLAIVLHHLLKLPIYLLLVLINIPLLFFGVKYLGRKFAVDTTFCIVLISVFVAILTKIIPIPALSNNLLLSTLYGGISIGIGLGLIFKGGASAGGGTILAKIIAVSTGFKTSTIILVLDALVIIMAGIIFKSLEIALWSLISIYTASKLIDTILVGAPNKKIVHLSSSKNLTELSNLIFQQLNIKGTVVTGNDLANTEHKDIIFILIDKNKLNILKQLVHSYDKNIIMIVMEAAEILGTDD